MFVLKLSCVLFIAGFSVAHPVMQPVYPQYYTSDHTPQAQPLQQVQYRQPLYYSAGPAGPSSHPVNEQTDPQPQYVAQPATSINQPLLGAVDRQIQKAAHHIAGPSYAQQIQSLQLVGQAQQAQAQVQRNALRLATAPRAQPLQYQRALQPVEGRSHQAPEPELQEDYNHNPSYQFGFDVKDDLYTNYQNRKEQREGDKITGSYSVVDSDGFIRTVTYTADPKEGFKAEVTRQPTDIVVKIPQPQPQYQHQNEQQYQRQPQYVEASAQHAPQAGPAYDKQPQQQQQQRYVYQYQ